MADVVVFIDTDTISEDDLREEDTYVEADS